MNKASCVRVDGPLARYALGFREELSAQGYTDSSAASQLHLVAHLSRWLAGQGLDAGGLTPERIERFFIVRRGEGRSVHRSPRAVVGVLSYLRGLGVAPAETPPDTSTPAGLLLARYRDYLVQEKGLAATTVTGYDRVARCFVTEHGADAADLESLSAEKARRLLARVCVGLSGASARNVASAVRSWLRFLYLEGLIALPLAQAIPTGPVRADRSLTQAVDRGEVAVLLGTCDRSSVLGRRDYAVLLVLTRLGLRAGEVAALALDDIDWRAAEVVIRGKGRRLERLPLPTDVGEALAGYLCEGRPDACCRGLFVRLLAPHRALGATAITQIVYRACDRAGLARFGAHRLRHTTATGMLAAGASLHEIGALLRHRSGQVTALYAKADHDALRVVAAAWPGGVA
jgi:site-specific recombinase XerD